MDTLQHHLGSFTEDRAATSMWVLQLLELKGGGGCRAVFALPPSASFRVLGSSIDTIDFTRYTQSKAKTLVFMAFVDVEGGVSSTVESSFTPPLVLRGTVLYGGMIVVSRGLLVALQSPMAEECVNPVVGTREGRRVVNSNAKE